MAAAKSHLPDGFHTVTPYFHVEGAKRLLDFIVAAFDAEITYTSHTPDGMIMHASARIGDSMIELADAHEKWPAMPCGIHLYVPDTDAAYRKALQAGATSLYEPADMFYGERSGGVRDPLGNHWYIATHIEDVSPEELARRAQQMRGQQQ